jgi:hypothetical protein
MWNYMGLHSIFSLARKTIAKKVLILLILSVSSSLAIDAASLLFGKTIGEQISQLFDMASRYITSNMYCGATWSQ